MCVGELHPLIAGLGTRGHFLSHKPEKLEQELCSSSIMQH